MGLPGGLKVGVESPVGQLQGQAGALRVAGVPQSPWHPRSYVVPASPAQPDTRLAGHI